VWLYAGGEERRGEASDQASSGTVSVLHLSGEQKGYE
jgi:hypothetical protein